MWQVAGPNYAVNQPAQRPRQQAGNRQYSQVVQQQASGPNHLNNTSPGEYALCVTILSYYTSQLCVEVLVNYV